MLSIPTPTPLAPERADTPSGDAQPFCGSLQPLRHVGVVRSGTVVVAWPSSGSPELRHPGELLVPAPPWLPPVRVLPVRTTPADLLVTVTDLVTLDSCPLDEVDVWLRVQLDPTGSSAAVLPLAAEHEDRLGNHLLGEVLRAVEETVRAAVRMNREIDLRRRTLAAVLADRWLPVAYAGGRLRRVDFSVPRVRWPVPEATALRLSTDERLHRIWRRHSDEEPLGIVGARVGNWVSVLVALPRPARPYEVQQAREDFAPCYGGSAVTVLPVLAGSYRSIVESWLAQLDLGSLAVAGLEINERAATLTVRLDQALPEPDPARPGWDGVDGSQVKALRRLLPFRAVRLVGGEEPPR